MKYDRQNLRDLIDKHIKEIFDYHAKAMKSEITNLTQDVMEFLDPCDDHQWVKRLDGKRCVKCNRIEFGKW